MGGSIVNLHQVSYRYSSGTQALDHVSIELPEGKRIALLGANGAGKSTLMLLLNGILKPTTGHLSYQSAKYVYQRKKLRTLRTKVGLLFQDSDNQLIAPTVYEEVSFGLRNITDDKEWIRKKVEQSIAAFCLENIQDKSPHQLSSGQKKRVCLASIVAMEPELLVCDEPTASLDPKHTAITFNILNRLHRQGKTILISTHDVNQAYAWADFVIIMKNGKVLCTGDAKKVFSNKKLLEEAGLNQPYIVETCQSLRPGINYADLPQNIAELKQLLNKVSCTVL